MLQTLESISIFYFRSNIILYLGGNKSKINIWGANKRLLLFKCLVSIFYSRHCLHFGLQNLSFVLTKWQTTKYNKQ